MKKILVIDDDGIARDALLVFLTRGGFEVLTASDGGNGLLAFKNSCPDLVILDRELPVMSGSEVLGKIRAENRLVPVIILTGYDSPDDAEKYMRDGATSFLSKGDGLSPVLAEVERLLGTPGTPRHAKRAGRETGYAKVVPAAAGAAEIIVADDDETIIALLLKFLRSLGYSVRGASNGREALQLAAAIKPDIVLLDISMPEMNGVEALAAFVSRYPGTGVLMITGNDDEELARETLRMGAFDYVPKPVNLEALGARIKARLLLQGKS